MIKALGPMEDASDLASIAPILHHWADIISKADKQVGSLSFFSEWPAPLLKGFKGAAV